MGGFTRQGIDMIPRAILDWQEAMFILSCALYENDQETVLSDKDFDFHASWLLTHYDELSPEFTARVERQNLECGSSLGLEFTEQELMDAIEWRERVRPQT